MTNKIIEFWSSMGWVSNLITILVGITTLVALLHKVPPRVMHSLQLRKFNRVLNYVKSKLSNERYILEELKKDSRIAIVDDNPEDFHKILRRSGYTVVQHEKISLADSDQLADYAVIYLDIAGVVPEDPKDGGLLLLRRLKELPKPPAIIAVSGKKFDPTVTEFFQAADDVMTKPLSEEECESHLREALIFHLSPWAAGKRIDDLTTKVGLVPSEQEAVTKKIIQCFEGRVSESKLEIWLSKKGMRDWTQIHSDIQVINKWLLREKM